MSGFHSTAGHFASLNAIGAETCKLNTLNFHEKDISTSCQFLLALYFWGRVQSFQYSPFPLLFHYLLSYSPLSEEMWPLSAPVPLHWTSSWESTCGKKCTILPGKYPKGSFGSVKMTCQHFTFNMRFLSCCSRGFGLWYLQTVLRSWGGHCVVMLRYQLHTDVRHLLGEHKEALKQSWSVNSISFSISPWLCYGDCARIIEKCLNFQTRRIKTQWREKKQRVCAKV